MSEDSLLIHELAERAGVSVRTIRYYVAEGLLPPPQAHGRYSLYDEDYLYRLRLIQRLKEVHLPLKEIRRQLDALTPEIVRELAEKESSAAAAELAPAPFSPAPPAPGSSALEYISQILRSQSSAPSIAPQAHRAPPPAEETWQRIRLAPGVELHVQQPLPAATRDGIAKLIEFARRAL